MNYYKLPFYILIGFNLFTIILYSFQPFILNNGNYIYTILYLLLNILALYWGINKGLAIKGRVHRTNAARAFNPKTFKIIFFFYLFTFLIKYSYDLYCPIYDVRAIFNRIMIGLYDPQLGYSLKGVRQIPWSLYFVVCIIDNIFFIWGLLSWQYMKKSYRLLFLVLCVFEILFWFGKGTNFGVIIMISSFLFSFLLTSSSTKKIKFKQTLLYCIGIVILFFASVLVFQHNMEARSGGDLEAINTDAIALTNAMVDYDNIIFNVVPTPFKTLYLMISSYLTQGYYALSYSFDCDFNWCYGVGNTPAIMSLADFFGINVEPRTYQTQIYELFHIDPYVAWHSFYLWIANDVSLVGVPLLVFFVGWCVSYSYKLYKERQDFLSGVVFVIFANMILLFFANNNYLSSVYYSFMFIFPYWFLTRYYRIKW